jgi:hypothetical protein
MSQTEDDPFEWCVMYAPVCPVTHSGGSVPYRPILLVLLAALAWSGDDPAADAPTFLTEPRLTGVTTSWVGNTWGGWTGGLAATPGWPLPGDRTVRLMPGLQGLAMADDGRLYAVGRADGRGSAIFHQGAMIGWIPVRQHHSGTTGAITVDHEYIYQAVQIRGRGKPDEKKNEWGGRWQPGEGVTWYGVQRCTLAGLHAPWPGGDGWFGNTLVIGTVEPVVGLAADGTGRLFVSEPAGRILVVEAVRMSVGKQVDAPRPGPLAWDRARGRLWQLQPVDLARAEHAVRINCGGQAAGDFAADSVRWRGKQIDAPGPVAVAGVVGAAPAEVYATAWFHGSDSAYWPDGFIPGTPVRVRFHLCEYAAKPGVRAIDLLVNDAMVAEGLDVAARAGGMLKAMVIETTSHADQLGKVRVQFRKQRGDGVALCGVEVVGNRVTDRVAAPAAIISFDRELRPTAERIVFAAEDRPEGIAVAADGDVLAADRGPACMVRRFDAEKRWREIAGFGVKGGVFAPPLRGQAGPDRLFFPTCVAVAPDGSVVVGEDGNLVEADISGGVLSCFEAGGSPRWRVEGHPFMDEPDWDRGADRKGSLLLYGPSRSYQVDPDAPAGDGWSWAAATVDRFRFPFDVRTQWSALSRDTVWFRRIGGKPFLFLSAGGPMVIYRFDPERHGLVAVPCAAWAPDAKLRNKFPGSPASGEWVWRDADGDGQAEAGEYIQRQGEAGLGADWDKPEAPQSFGLDVDTEGGLWTALSGRGLRRLALALGADGVAAWGFEGARGWPAPTCFAKADLGRIAVDLARDRVLLTGVDTVAAPPYTNAAQEGPNGRQVGNLLARFDGVLAAAPGTMPPATWTVPLVFDTQRLRSRHTARDLPNAVAAEGDHVFVASTAQGRIRVFAQADGRFLGMMEAGPSLRPAELDDQGGTDRDPNMIGLIDTGFSLRARRMGDASYLLSWHDCYLNRTVIYRWRPAATPPAPPWRMTARQAVADPATSLELAWETTPGATSWRVERLVEGPRGGWREAATVREPRAVVTGLAAETAWLFRVQARGADGLGDYGPVRRAVTAGRAAMSVDLGAGTAMAADEQAGLVPRLAWNRAVGGSAAEPLALRDDRGRPSGMSLRWSGGTEILNARSPDLPGDQRLLRGQLVGKEIVLRLAGIPWKRYDLIVLADHPKAAAMRVRAGGRMVRLAEANNDGWNGGYWPVTAEGFGNAAVFTGLSGADLEIICDGDPAGSRAPGTVAEGCIGGLQVIERP